MNPTTKKHPRTLKQAFGHYTDTRIFETPPQRKQRLAQLIDNIALFVLAVANIAIAVFFISEIIPNL